MKIVYLNSTVKPEDQPSPTMINFQPVASNEPSRQTSNEGGFNKDILGARRSSLSGPSKISPLILARRASLCSEANKSGLFAEPRRPFPSGGAEGRRRGLPPTGLMVAPDNHRPASALALRQDTGTESPSGGLSPQEDIRPYSSCATCRESEEQPKDLLEQLNTNDGDQDQE